MIENEIIKPPVKANQSYENPWFSRKHLKENLKQKSLQSAVSKATANGFSFMLSIASTMILARLLSPKDFGLLAMVLAVTEFARSFRELGLGAFTVQREEIAHSQISTLFWINLGFGLLLMVALIALAPVLVWFYGESRLFHICIVLSSVFLFGGLTVQHRALLERQMKFAQLGIIMVVSYLGGFSLAIYLALNGFGVWALVGSEVLSTGLYALGTWVFCRWIPGPLKFHKDIKSSLQFGSHISAFEIIHYLSRNIDRMLIGRVFGASSLGLYAKAFQLAMMPIEQIRMVFWDIGFSPLSALQNEANRFRNFYSRFLSVLSFVYMPFVLFLIIKPESVILLMLGQKWISAAPIMRIVAIGGFVRPLVATFQLVMISSNQTKRYLKWGLFNGIIMIVAFGLGIQWGIIGVAAGFAAASYISCGVAFLYCLKVTPINPLSIFKTVKIPLLASCGAGTILALMPANIYPDDIVLNLASYVSIMVLSYAVILLCIPTGRQQVVEFWSYRKELFSRA